MSVFSCVYLSGAWMYLFLFLACLFLACLALPRNEILLFKSERVSEWVKLLGCQDARLSGCQAVKLSCLLVGRWSADCMGSQQLIQQSHYKPAMAVCYVNWRRRTRRRARSGNYGIREIRLLKEWVSATQLTRHWEMIKDRLNQSYFVLFCLVLSCLVSVTL